MKDEEKINLIISRGCVLVNRTNPNQHVHKKNTSFSLVSSLAFSPKSLILRYTRAIQG